MEKGIVELLDKVDDACRERLEVLNNRYGSHSTQRAVATVRALVQEAINELLLAENYSTPEKRYAKPIVHFKEKHLEEES